jgi:hypothetical protein
MGANAQTSVPTFVQGQVLTSAQQNLINTGVPVAADASARDGLFGGTGEKTLAEGQLVYLEDLDIVQYYDGSSWLTLAPTTSGVIQVKSTTKDDAFTTTSATFVDVTGLSVSITPTSASNKILVLYSVSGNGTDVASAGATGVQLMRDSTAIAVGTAGTLENFTGLHSIRNLGASTSTLLNTAASHLDSPATTSAITYKIQAKAAAGTFYINKSGDTYYGAISTITVMEVLP